MVDQSAAETPHRLARRLIQSRRVEEALPLLEEIVAADDTDRVAHELLGTACFMSRRFEDAKTAFERLVRLDPQNSTSWVNLGAVQNVLKEHQQAVKSFRKAIQRDKRCASAYYNMGIAQRACNMNAMAISAYREAIRLDPEMAEAYTNLGNLYIEMNNLNKAVKLLEDGLKHCPQSRKLMAVLEKARRARDGIRKEVKPLGRLVDEEALQKRQLRFAPRKLSSTQRVHERETLHDLGKVMRRNTKPIVELLKGPLKKQLHLLDLAAANNDPRNEAPAAFEQMTETLVTIFEHRQTTKQAAIQIKQQLDATEPAV
ncbi:MAG: hypothetical protein Fues2KO_01270 [Fuerstiella sp.]